MSASIIDLKGLNQAYTRLSEKFKTFWTFHQFLQGIHKTFFGNAPAYQVDFQGLYDEIKNVTVAMTFQPPAVVLDQINRLDAQLDVVYRTLSEDDRKIAPSYVRRFFERVKTEDEKLLMAILRFYFFSRVVSHDDLDKIDYLITVIGARRSLDDGHYIPRFPQELQKLFGSFLALARRPAIAPEDVKSAVTGFEVLKRDVEGCRRFEDLTEKKILENLRTLKHRLGPTFFSADVLSAILETNLAAKNKFQALYEDEEQRINDSSRQLLEMEKELERNPRFRGEELQEEFRRFRQYREEFEKQGKERGVRHREVAQLAESIDHLMAKFEIASGVGPSPFDREAPGFTGAVTESTGPEADPEPAPQRGPTETTLAGWRPDSSTVGAAAGPAAEGSVVPASARDPLTAEAASKILYSIEMLEEGTGSGTATYHKTLQRLRLEPWEVRAARRITAEELPTDPVEREVILLFFDTAALRFKIEEEAAQLRGYGPAGSEDVVLQEKLNECGLCLIRAQETDRRFRAALESAMDLTSPSEKINELNRSRFRLLRSFAGLWLLHNSRVSG